MDNPKTDSRSPLNANVPAHQSTARPTAPQVEIDDSKSTAQYANLCRLSVTPEELLIDFGFSSHPMATTVQKVIVTQRVVAGWHTAKRLVQVLQQTIEHHEAMFGDLETDVQKRLPRA